MVHRRPISITITVDPETGAEPGEGQESMGMGQGPSAIEQRLEQGGEDSAYAQEHSARIWNGSHPEAPVASSFDRPEAGFVPKLLPELPEIPDYRKSVYSSGRPAVLPRR